MASKKKKRKPSQAAAARYESTPESEARAQARERAKLIRQSAQEAQRKASKGVGFRMIVPFFLFAAIVAAAIAFTVGPGMLLGR